MRVTARWQTDPIRWDESDILLVVPPNFAERVEAYFRDLPAAAPRLAEAKKRLLERARDKYFSRMGWMTRAHPTQLASGRILLPLYSDGYSFSLVGISDDRGATWRASEPIVGLGNVQPSIVPRKDGTLVAYMRDNGPAPKRVQWSESKDNGETWSPARDTEFANSGTGLEAIILKDGRWLLVNNDTETGRNRLNLSLSDDEGRSWKWSRAVEHDTRAERPSSFHYPSIRQARDGSILLSYSLFLNHVPEGQPRKTIRVARLPLAWLTAKPQ
jgi:predicted neuraminidase